MSARRVVDVAVFCVRTGLDRSARRRVEARRPLPAFCGGRQHVRLRALGSHSRHTRASAHPRRRHAICKHPVADRQVRVIAWWIKTKLMGPMLQQWRRIDYAKGRSKLCRPLSPPLPPFLPLPSGPFLPFLPPRAGPCNQRVCRGQSPR